MTNCRPYVETRAFTGQYMVHVVADQPALWCMTVSCTPPYQVNFYFACFLLFILVVILQLTTTFNFICIFFFFFFFGILVFTLCLCQHTETRLTFLNETGNISSLVKRATRVGTVHILALNKYKTRQTCSAGKVKKMPLGWSHTCLCTTLLYVTPTIDGHVRRQL